MNEIKDGGPAFPCDPWAASDPKNVTEAKRIAEGMTLRDYFAAKAMQGLMASNVRASLEAFANQAYKMADALLKAREEK
jgi:hypothetical protein